MMFDSIRKSAVGLALGLGLSMPLATVAQEGEPVSLLFAAAPAGTTWYAYAGSLQPIIEEGLPQGSTVSIMNTPMSIANAKLLAAGRADIGMTFPPVASWATQGFGPFNQEITNMRGLVGGMDQYYQRITVQEDSDIQSLAEIKQKELPVNIGTGPQGSLNEYICRLILASYDLTYEDIESFGGSVSRTSFEVLRNLFGDGRIDMIIGITTQGHPNTAQLSITPGHRFLGLSEESIEYLTEYGFAEVTMPANMFEGQSKAIKGVGFSTALYANASLSDDHAYSITKSVMESREQIKQQFGSMESWTAEGSAENLGVPLHPGAQRYYEEADLLD